MLSYLAAALPAGASAAARLIALQCALRMNASMQVRLPLGLLRGLRLGATLSPWRELEQARWLRRIPGRAADEVAAVLLDAALLGQAPARTDRRRAADWALRGSRPSRAGVLGPLPQLMSVYLAAHSQSETGQGLNEADRTAHECGIQPAELPHMLEQLTMAGLLDSWQIASDTEDFHWILGFRSEGEPRVAVRQAMGLAVLVASSSDPERIDRATAVSGEAETAADSAGRSTGAAMPSNAASTGSRSSHSPTRCYLSRPEAPTAPRALAVAVRGHAVFTAPARGFPAIWRVGGWRI